LQLPPVTYNHTHFLAVELCTDFNWLQLVATASNFLQKYSPACCLNCPLVLTDCNCFQLVSGTYKNFQFVSAACSSFTSGQQHTFFEFSAPFQVAIFPKIFQNKLDI